MICNYLFRSPFFCDQCSLYLLHKTLTYFGSIFNGIIMIILDIDNWYNFIWTELPKWTESRKIRFFPYFGIFWVPDGTERVKPIAFVELTYPGRTFRAKGTRYWHRCNNIGKTKQVLGRYGLKKKKKKIRLKKKKKF